MEGLFVAEGGGKESRIGAWAAILYRGAAIVCGADEAQRRQEKEGVDFTAEI